MHLGNAVDITAFDLVINTSFWLVTWVLVKKKNKQTNIQISTFVPLSPGSTKQIPLAFSNPHYPLSLPWCKQPSRGPSGVLPP